jgi:carbamate kinase
MTMSNQQANVRAACDHLASIAAAHELVVSHGNGPQIGLLALEEAAYHQAAETTPLDVLGAETQGMIGYLIEQELGNRLPAGRPLASLLTMVEVDPGDPAFGDPCKPIGPLYSFEEAEKLAQQRGWAFKPDGDSMRRVVSSPAPRQIVEERPIRWLLDRGCVVVCAGGGGIPVAARDGGQLTGVEAVIDKDSASALLARDIQADLLIMATDAPGAFIRYGTPDERLVRRANPTALLSRYAPEFAPGSMLPKVTAACAFARSPGTAAVIGALADLDRLLTLRAGTVVSVDVDGVQLEARSVP